MNKFEETFNTMIDVVAKQNEKNFGVLAPMMTDGVKQMKEIFKAFYEEGYNHALIGDKDEQ